MSTTDWCASKQSQCTPCALATDLKGCRSSLSKYPWQLLPMAELDIENEMHVPTHRVKVSQYDCPVLPNHAHGR
eukprot:4461871-Pyramimonas_sp.AAC.1